MGPKVCAPTISHDWERGKAITQDSFLLFFPSFGISFLMIIVAFFFFLPHDTYLFALVILMGMLIF